MNESMGVCCTVVQTIDADVAVYALCEVVSRREITCLHCDSYSRGRVLRGNTTRLLCRGAAQCDVHGGAAVEERLCCSGGAASGVRGTNYRGAAVGPR